MQKELEYIIMEYALIVYGGYIPLICQTEEIQCVVNTCPNRSELFYCVLCSIIRKCVLFYKSVLVYHFLNGLSLSYPVLSRMGVHACRTAILLLFSGQYNKIFVDSFALTFPGAWHSSPGRKESTVDDSAILTRLFAPLSVRGQILWKGRIA